MKSLIKTSPYGVLSFLSELPFVLGAGFALVVYLVATSDILDGGTVRLIFVVGSVVFMLWFVLVLVLAIAGVSFGVVSLVRREKRPLMPIVGMLLNACPLISMILILLKNPVF
jgi:multisubunit Na+/H+ antiporter MnhE subunit